MLRAEGSFFLLMGDFSLRGSDVTAAGRHLQEETSHLAVYLKVQWADNSKRPAHEAPAPLHRQLPFHLLQEKEQRPPRPSTFSSSAETRSKLFLEKIHRQHQRNGDVSRAEPLSVSSRIFSVRDLFCGERLRHLKHPSLSYFISLVHENESGVTGITSGQHNLPLNASEGSPPCLVVCV